LLEILQITVSKYRQGISDDEIEEEIEKRMLDLGIELEKEEIELEISQLEAQVQVSAK